MKTTIGIKRPAESIACAGYLVAEEGQAAARR